jgi:hypothetical protein
VATTDWLSMADLAKAIADTPDSYAQWLKLYIAGKTSPPLEFLATR